ncbi:MAG: ABC transporter ATP-binding protein [Deltaproteobacteria bacterium]|nr:ABC transporter ATP-binding protein [Deltaproteobacteria bacterium]
MGILRRFLGRYARPHVRSYVGGLVFLVATTALTLAIPTFVEQAVDAMAHAGDAEPPGIWGWALAIILAGFAIMVVRTLSRVLFFNPGRVIEYEMKSDLFGHLTELPKAYYDRMRPGEIVSRGTNDAAGVRAFIGFGSLQIFNVVITLVLTIGKMLISDWSLTLLCLAPLLIAVAILRKAIGEMFKLMRRGQEEMANLSARVLETYGGVPVIQAFNATPLALRRFDERNEAMLAVSQRAAFVMAWLLPIVDIVGNGCLVLLLFVGGSQVVAGELTLGQLAAFTIYIRIVAGGLNSLGWVINALQRGWISLGRTYDVLDAPTERTDAARPMPPPERGHELVVKDLSFTYPGAERPALDGVSFRVERGGTLGIFGATGSGKTTLLATLARVYEPPAGSVSVDGVDAREIALPTYWKAMALVPQDAWLFSQTLRENVAIADAADERDEARVEDAVRAAALGDDLQALPEGLDTRVGERGITLSGGQRQRAALARAFYRDFEVLLLDDVLSAVDHATERRLIANIEARARQGHGATTVIVSHRVSALKAAQEIIVLDRGRVVARGTHEALLADEAGIYYKAWRLQRAREAEGLPDVEPSLPGVSAEAAGG